MAVRTTYFFGSYSSFSPYIAKINSGANGTYTITTDGVYTYSYDIITSDGQTFSGITTDITITFPDINTVYFIEIRGLFPRHANFGQLQSLKDKLLEIIQLGDVVLDSNQTNTYRDCYNMQGLPNDFGLNSVVDGNYMFDQTAITSLPPSTTLESIVTAYAMFRQTNLIGVVNLNIPNCTNFRSAFRQTNLTELHIQNMDNVVSIDALAFFIPTLTKLTCGNLGLSFSIRYSPLLTGIEIDNLANSVRDLTGVSSATVTMTTAQYSSGIDTTIWTNKNWTITQV